MSTQKTLTLCALLGTASLGVALAQTPPPPSGSSSTSPETASSPHQRDASHQNSAETAPGGSPEAGAASTAHQKEATGKMKMAGGKDGADPATFVKKAALGGMTEVELAKIAQTKAQDEKVRSFASRMVQDHSKANAELVTLAKGKGMQVPAALDAEHKAVVQKLSAKSGADFDSAYSKQMMEDHEKTVALFESASMSSDKELAAFAKKTLPTLKEHEQMADTLPGATHSADAATSTPRRQ